MKLLLSVFGRGAGHWGMQQPSGAQPRPPARVLCFGGRCAGWQPERVWSPSGSLPVAHWKQRVRGPGMEGPEGGCGGSAARGARGLDPAASCPWLGLPALGRGASPPPAFPSRRLPRGLSPCWRRSLSQAEALRGLVQVGGCVSIDESQDLFWLQPRSSHRSPKVPWVWVMLSPTAQGRLGILCGAMLGVWVGARRGGAEQPSKRSRGDGWL